MGIIRIEDIRCFAYHGCMEEEGVIGTVFSVDVELKADLGVSAKSDLLADTIDYVAVSKLVQEEMAVKSKLIEHVTQRILNRLMKDFPSVESSKEIIASDPMTTNLCSLKGCNQLTNICPFTPFLYSN